MRATQQPFFRNFIETSIFKRIALSLLLTATVLYSLLFLANLLIKETNNNLIDENLYQTAKLIQAHSINSRSVSSFTLDQVANHFPSAKGKDFLLFRPLDYEQTGFHDLNINGAPTDSNNTVAESTTQSLQQWRLLTFRNLDGKLLTVGYPAYRPLSKITMISMTGFLLVSLLIVTIGLIALLTAFKHFRQLLMIRTTIQGFARGDITRRVPAFSSGSDLNKLGNSLNAILNRSEYLMTNSRQIINNISHDLRKPLTRIKNRLELLQFETTDNYQIAELDRSIQDADSLLKTFNDLLSISQAETGMHRDAFEKVSLRAICEDMIEMYEPIAEERGVTIKMVVDNPFTIIGNKQLLTQLISNLIDNACKYAAGENGQLIIFAESTLHHTTLRFADNGPGIPLELREKVLERFVRLDAARTAEGNGLGLSLAKAVMELHQGELVLGRTSQNDQRPGLLVKLVFPKVDQSSKSKTSILN